MMKKAIGIIFGLLCILSGARAHAACGTITSGMTPSQLQAAINACSSGQTAQFPAGTWTLTTHLSLPCGVSIQGPAPTNPWPGPYTANLNGSLGASWGIFMPGGGCTAAMTIQYFNWNGGQPSTGGGGFIYFPQSAESNVTIQYNHIYGNQAGQPSASAVQSATFIYMDGYANATSSSPIQTNVTIQYNYFGSTAHTDCSNVMQLTTYYGGSYDGAVGGQCAAWGMHTGGTNVIFQYNKVEFQEQGVKFYEVNTSGYQGQVYPCRVQSYCDNNVSVNYNDFSYIHRIGIENQANPSTTMNFDYNVFREIYYGQYGSWWISDPAYYAPSGGPYTGPVTSNVNGNLFIGDAACVGSGCYTPGIEFWSTGTANYNLCQVGSGIGSLGFAFGNGNVPWSISNNTLQNCSIRNEGEGGYPSVPTQTGNSSTGTVSALTSVAPTVSPGAGAVTAGTVISISNPGTNRDSNTSDWCTTDGTTPVPGSGTATIMTSYTVTAAVTLKCVGMWGAINQPTSYATNYGYVPSAVSTYAYSISGGGVTLSSVSIAATGGGSSVQVGSTLQMVATCTYSDGSTTGCNTTDSHGNSVTGWTSSAAAATINSSGLATGVSIGNTNLQATVTGGKTSNVFALSVSSALNTLQSVTLSTTGGVSSIPSSSSNQLTASCNYSNGTVTNCTTGTDSYGNTVNTWASSAPAAATVNATGLVSGVAAGSTNITASVIPQPAQLGGNVYNFTNSTHGGYLNYTYAVTGTAASGYAPNNCYVYLPSGTIPSGTQWDCVLIAAPSGTTQAANALCSNRYTFSSSTSWPGGFITIPMTSCPTLSPDTPYWLASDQNQTTANRGEWSCSSTGTTGSCGTTLPTLGSGNYAYCYYDSGFGTYTGMSAALTCGQTYQITQYLTTTESSVTSANLPLTITPPPPTLTGVTITASPATIPVGATTQLNATCTYSDSSTTSCNTPDSHGNGVGSWNSGANSVATVSTSGLVSGVAGGTAGMTATVGSFISPSFTITVTPPVVNLIGVTLSTTGGVTGLFVGATNQLIATCSYSDGSTTNCTTTDSHGNIAGAYTSSNTSHATVNATTGLVTGVAAGGTSLTCSAGAFASPAIPLTILAVPTGVYQIIITGPVKFTGTVKF